jgi:hypothetical protein
VLERERNQQIVAQIRDVGARIKLITAGDVGGALEAALETRSGVHCMMGSGGATEGVLAACAIKTIGGDMQAKLFFRDEKERQVAVKEGHEPNKILHLDDLCSGSDIFFAATGITSGELLKGVRYEDVPHPAPCASWMRITPSTSCVPRACSPSRWRCPERERGGAVPRSSVQGLRKGAVGVDRDCSSALAPADLDR